MHPHSSVLCCSRKVGRSKELSYCSVNLSLSLKNLFKSKVIRSFKKFNGEHWHCLIAVRKREDSQREGKSVRKVEKGVRGRQVGES